MPPRPTKIRIFSLVFGKYFLLYLEIFSHQSESDNQRLSTYPLDYGKTNFSDLDDRSEEPDVGDGGNGEDDGPEDGEGEDDDC